MHRVSFLALSCITVTQLACADDVCLGSDDCPLGKTCSANGTCEPMGLAHDGERMNEDDDFDDWLGFDISGTLEGSIGGRSFDGVADGCGSQRSEYTLLAVQTYDDSAEIDGAVILKLNSRFDALPLSTEIVVTSPVEGASVSGLAEAYVSSHAWNVHYHYHEPVESGSLIIEEQEDGARVVTLSTQLGDETTLSRFTVTPVVSSGNTGDRIEATFEGTMPQLTSATIRGDIGGRTGFNGPVNFLWTNADLDNQWGASVLMISEQQPIGVATFTFSTRGIDLQDIPVGRTVFFADDYLGPISVGVSSGQNSRYNDFSEHASGEVIVTERDDGTRDVEIHTNIDGELAVASFSYTL